jgi:integrase
LGQYWDWYYICINSNMARINFLIRSKNNPARIYVRIRDGKAIDVKMPTNFYIDSENWNPTKGKPKNLNNPFVKKLDTDLDALYIQVLSNINELKSSDSYTNETVKELLNPKSDNTENSINKELLTNYFEHFIEKLQPQIKIGKIQKTTLTKYNVILGIVREMEKYYNKKYKVKDVDLDFTKAFDFYCIDVKKYMPNTAGRAIKFIKTVCRDARISGIETNLHLDSIKGYTRKSEFIILTPTELELIEKHEFKNATLDNARDWLVISCYTGQRVSDFLRFNENMLVEVETPSGKKALMLEFIQVKTNKEMRLPLHPKIIDIIKKRDGRFPNKLSDQRYNEYIKLVCKEVGLTQMVKGSKVDQETNRKQSGRFEKWELITSHIGRRSFASNNYGKLQTPLIMYATGHTTEKMLLNYIGKTNEDKAFELLKYMEL